MSGRGRVTAAMPWSGIHATGSTGEGGSQRQNISHRDQVNARRDPDALRTLLVERMEALRSGADHAPGRPYPSGPYTPTDQLPF